MFSDQRNRGPVERERLNNQGENGSWLLTIMIP